MDARATGQAVDQVDEGAGGVEVLSAATCWHLLRSTPFGRFAVVDADGEPDLFPVNHAVDGASIVFRTASGSKLTAVTAGDDPRGAPAAFEVDGVQEGPDGRTAWSVVVRGRAHQVTRIDELLATTGVAVAPWQAGGKGRFVRLVGEVSGRRFHVSGSGWW